tara:strand:+ start:1745 stop:1972 length:228 start_codon:yes stop_codon:yes gene_type:complete
MTTKFNKTFSIENFANIYTANTEKNTYKLYRERTYKNNGTSKCDGDWIVQRNDSILESFKTLRQAKNYVSLIELF